MSRGELQELKDPSPCKFPEKLYEISPFWHFLEQFESLRPPQKMILDMPVQLHETIHQSILYMQPL